MARIIARISLFLEEWGILLQLVSWRTNTVNLYLDPWTHDLVPSVYAPYEPSGTIEGSSAAERVREGCVWGKIALDRCSLDGGSGLDERADDVGDFGDCGRVLVLGAALLGWGGG